jgi:hypothetical protein
MTISPDNARLNELFAKHRSLAELVHDAAGALNGLLEEAGNVGLRADAEIITIQHFGRQDPTVQVQLRLFRPL